MPYWKDSINATQSIVLVASRSWTSYCSCTLKKLYNMMWLSPPWYAARSQLPIETLRIFQHYLQDSVQGEFGELSWDSRNLRSCQLLTAWNSARWLRQVGSATMLQLCWALRDVWRKAKCWWSASYSRWLYIKASLFQDVQVTFLLFPHLLSSICEISKSKNPELYLEVSNLVRVNFNHHGRE